MIVVAPPFARKNHPAHRAMRMATSSLVAVAVLGIAGCDKRPDSTGERASVPERPRHRANDRQERERLSREVQNCSGDPSRLAGMLDEALASGAMENDERVKLAFLSNLANFDAKTLAKLATSGEPGFGGCVIPQMLTKSTDVTLVSGYFVALGDSTEAKNMLLQHLGSDSPLLGPESISSTLTHLPTLSDSELKSLGSGLASRLRLGIVDAERRSEAINAYLAVINEPLVLERIVPTALSFMDLDDAISWLEQVPTEAAKFGDMTLMRNLTPDTYAKGFDFINKLIDNDQVPRAQKATEVFLFRYSAAVPDDAMKWVLSQEKAFVTTQMLTTAYTALYRSDPEKARRLLETIQDASQKEVLGRAAQAVDKPK